MRRERGLLTHTEVVLGKKAPMMVHATADTKKKSKKAAEEKSEKAELTAAS